MIGILIAFLVVFGFFYFGITAVRDTTGKEKLVLTKVTLYAILCSMLTTAFLITIVILF